MRRVTERMSKYYHSTLTVHRPVDIQTVEGRWVELPTGTYEVQQVNEDDRKFAIRAYGEEVIVEEIELDSIVAGREASVERGAPSQASRDDSYIAGPDFDDDEEEDETPSQSRSPRSSNSSSQSKSKSQSKSSSSASSNKSGRKSSSKSKSSSSSSKKSSTSSKKSSKSSTSSKKSSNKKSSTSKKSTSKKSTSKKSTTKKSKSSSRKKSSTRSKKKKKENSYEITLNGPTLINETVYPAGTKIHISNEEEE